MTEPAKDEAELVKRVARDLWEVTLGQFPPWNGKSYLADAAIAIAAIRAAGWAVVPVEPTPQMARCGIEGADIRWSAASLSECLTDDEVSSIYRAMLAAALEVKL